MEYIRLYLENLYLLTNEMSPYLLLGFFFAGLIKAFISNKSIALYLGKSDITSVFRAALLGVPLPLCSCGVIPTGVSLYKNGASKGASQSFLISTPQTGVDSILATYGMLGLPLAIIRPILAFITGIIGGIITNVLIPDDKHNLNTVNVKEIDVITENRFVYAIRYAFYDLLMDIANWLIIGLLIAAFITTIFPENFFMQFLNNPLLSMVVILFISIPLYICATGSIPIAAALLAKGLNPGAAIVFLMAGPATNAATISVLFKSFGKKFTLIYLLVIIVFSMTAGLLTAYLMPASWFMLSFSHIHEHEIGWINVGSTIILLVTLIIGYFGKYLPKKSKAMNSNTIEIQVEGMTCTHCKANVENNLRRIPSIKTIEANHITGKVIISGDSVDINIVRKTITDIGYTLKK